jgi:hypothetical protein
MSSSAFKFTTARPASAAATMASAQDTLDTQAVLDTDLLTRPVFAARDAEWEAELLTHLSEQEQRLREFTRSRFRADPHEVLMLAVRTVQAIDAYTACHAERATLIRAHLPETRKAADQYLREAAGLPRPAPARTVFGFAVSAPRIEPAVRGECVRLLTGLPPVIEAYLLLLGNGFATGQSAAKWVETCGVFVRQLTKLTKHITE